MRAVLITPMLPGFSESDKAGVHRRMVVFLRALAAIASKVEILYIVPERMLALGDDTAALNRSQSAFWGVDVKALLAPRSERPETFWSHYGAGIFNAAAQPNLFPYCGAGAVAAVRSLLDTAPDLVLVDRLDAAIPVVLSGRQPHNMVFDFVDLYHVVLWRSLFKGAFVPGKLGFTAHMPSLILAERRVVSASALSLVCSEPEKRHLRRLGFAGRIEVVPNAITPCTVPPDVAPERTVLFLGSYHHPPNRLAAERLVRQIWPVVMRALPGARLIIAGPGSDTLPSRNIQQNGIEYLGFVEDLDALYAGARVFCAPIVSGSGTRLKMIEAASFARPIVSTPIAAEGLAFRDAMDILVRTTDEDLARACIALLQDDALCRRLGQAARATMMTHYDAESIARQAQVLFQEAVLF